MTEIVHSEITNSNWVLSQEETIYFNRLKERSYQEGKPMVLWGWKRDKVENGKRMPESRTVYFSADLDNQYGPVDIARSFFYLETRAKTEEIHFLKDQIDEDDHVSGMGEVAVFKDPSYEGYSTLRIMAGRYRLYDIHAIDRRLRGKPRITIPPPRIVPEANDFNISTYAPFAACVGSGLSSESGLPLLGSMHNLFEVDNPATGELVFGAMDGLPKRIASNPHYEYRQFCQFTIDAIKAQPSVSHEMLSNMYKNGIIEQVFTDNMDDILEKVGMPYTATRTSIFPDKYPVEFSPNVKSLLVVGVAVDRRSVIKQARRSGLSIVAINPVYGVAPHSRNMDYLRQGDIFFKQKAIEVLPKIIEASKF